MPAVRTYAMIALLTIAIEAPALEAQEAPSVLIVTAHPDDDAAFAATIYKVTRDLGGVADLALVTDGSGGFRYATLAEPIYGLELTDEEVARQYLPAIRKRELMAGGAIVGIRNYFFLDQYDHAFTTDPDTVMGFVWDTAFVRTKLTEIMERGDYDFAVGLLPFENMHGHHKAATILALRAALALPREVRPLVLGGFPCDFDGQPIEFTGLVGHPITTVEGGEPLGRFDRDQPIGFNGQLDYNIITNWVIAEHKSQGTMQLLMSDSGQECYWYFDVNGPEGRGRVTGLFERLSR